MGPNQEEEKRFKDEQVVGGGPEKKLRIDSPDDKARNANEHLGRHFAGGTLVDDHRHPQQQQTECTRQQHNNNTGGGGNQIKMLGRAMELMMIIQPNDRTQEQNSVNVNETTVD